ncbi:MAG: ribosome-associated translation inhibitor RaiA [Spirochaetes bacterium]|nr:ribosome-associated translation inhibitor RaiA [Spirochaetota bacterium]
MHVNIQGRHFKVRRDMREYIAKKMAKIKFYSKKIIDAHILLEEIKLEHKVEITIMLNGKVFRFAEIGKTFYEAIDLLFDKLERKVKSTKNIIKNHKHDAGIKQRAMANAGADDRDIDTVHMEFAPFADKPMDSIEAALELAADKGYCIGFFPIAKNTDMLNVQVASVPAFIIKHETDSAMHLFSYESGGIISTVFGKEGWHECSVSVAQGKVRTSAKKKIKTAECNVSTAWKILREDDAMRFMVFRNSVTGNYEGIYKNGKNKCTVIGYGR